MKSGLLQKALAGLFIMALVIGALLIGDLSVTVQAADTQSWKVPLTPQIAFGTKGIIDPAEPVDTNAKWTGCYVYYGMYDTDGDGVKEPVKYRVLDVDSTDYGEETMLLDADNVVFHSRFVNNIDDNREWKNTLIKPALNEAFYRDSFSTAEQNAITNSYKATLSSTDGTEKASDYAEYSPLTGEKIFILDAGEAMNPTYGYSQTLDAAASRNKSNENWWIRTWNSDLYSPNAIYIFETGDLFFNGITWAYGICPAFNIRRSDIFLSSVSGMDKSQEIKNDSTGILDTDSTERTLTLYDAQKQIELTADNGEAYIDSSENIWVPYRYTDAAEEDKKVNQISVMITDKAYTDADAKILYYGALQGIDDISQSEGMGRFSFPNGIDLDNAHVYLMAEHVGDANETDYVSKPVELSRLQDVIDSVEINLSIPTTKDRSFTSTATAVLHGQSDFNQTPAVIWKHENDTVSGNALYDTAYTADIMIDEQPGYAYAPLTKIRVNGRTVDASGIKFRQDGSLVVSYDYMLKSAKLKKVLYPQNISEFINGSSLKQIRQQFSDIISIETEDGTKTKAAIHWDFDHFAEGSYDQQLKTKQTFKIKGTVTLPEGISNGDNIPLEVIVPVTVDATITPVKKEETVMQDYKENSLKLNQKNSFSWKNGRVVVKWGALQGADGYDIYAEPCGKKFTAKSLSATIKDKKSSAVLVKIAGKKISEKKSYKIKIKAYRLVNGKKSYIAASECYHIAGKNNKRYTNAKKIIVSRHKVSLKKGKTTKIKAAIKKQSSKKKLLPKSHGKRIRYYSTDERIAVVTSQGLIKAKKKGTCYIYMTTLNGVKAKVKVTVK